jgi:RNA polymerase sigma-70 factor (ECF subfamily)
MAVQDGQAAVALVRQAASGDQAAFARLVADHHASMMRVAYVICGNGEVASDAVQSAWAIAWRRLGSLRDAGRVHSWLVAIAANEARQALRKQRRATIVDVSTFEDQPDRRQPSDAIPLIDLRRALTELPPDDRALLALRYVSGLDSNEIAAQLGLSGSGVRSRLARLLERLRLDLDPDGGNRR